MDATIAFTVNGEKKTVTTDPNRRLLDVLREDLGLTGTKFGCGRALCAACTVLVDGRPTFSCVTPIAEMEGKTVLTIEGLAKGDTLHAVQQAFLDEHAFQCGTCTPGMVLASVALLAATPKPTDEEILAALDRHVCRCGNYPRILKAVRRAAGIAPDNAAAPAGR
jgi:aerobic-type carbon monoxide dehydrogenase small subunit (CoxS/CutS family)